VPRSFRHLTCGTTTVMPPTVLATILRDPDLVADSTLCPACGRTVPFAECVWVGSGQDLQSYLDELRAQSDRDEWTDSFDWPDETETEEHPRRRS